MRERALSRADIETLLDALSERLHEKQAFAKLHLVGSACEERTHRGWPHEATDIIHGVH